MLEAAIAGHGAEVATSPVRKPRVTIVINTLNRAADLSRTLDSFRWLDDRYLFEVVVVNGPSTDHSSQVIAAQGDCIRSYQCPVANLSVSRNMGICAAAGEIIAFIDDDGIPEPEWLIQLVDAYDDPAVGAAGGFVFNHTGYDFQYRFGVADRFGNARIDLEAPSPGLNFPFTFEFPHLLGTNVSFRKDVLLEIGGFDEEFEYFLDETDVLARVVDAGYVVAQLSNAFVHHKFAPSHLRGHNRIVTNRFPILKNKVYFCIKQGRRFVGLDAALRAVSAFFDAQRREVRWLVGEGLAADDDVTRLEVTIERALERGLMQGLQAGSARPDRVWPLAAPADFRPFATIQCPNRLCLVLLSADYPPNRSGGIATLTAELGRALAAQGHWVHVITKSADIDRVDFEDGVWVHRMVVRSHPRSDDLGDRVPAPIWDWSATAFDEAVRISDHRDIDCIEAPIWDCEGVAFIDRRRWPLVISLHTTFHFWLEHHPDHRDSPVWMTSVGLPILELEKRLIEQADGIRANSLAIRRDIEAAYGIAMKPEIVQTIPHGIRWNEERLSYPSRTLADPEFTVLFVGRLERRKGIDTLLAAVPMIVGDNSNIRFRIVGDDSIPSDDGLTVRQSFEAKADAPALARVAFEGRVDDTIIEQAYVTCDLFVAPSRYESFGLVYVEALRAGVPIVACSTGGVPEVVDVESGILVPPDDPLALARAILCLAGDRDRGRRMGRHGRKQYEERFTASLMAERSVQLYQTAIRNRVQ